MFSNLGEAAYNSNGLNAFQNDPNRLKQAVEHLLVLFLPKNVQIMAAFYRKSTLLWGIVGGICSFLG